MSIPAVILAGGLARRMGGGDKCLVRIKGEPILAHILHRLGGQKVALNANGDAARFEAFGLPVLPDPVEGFPGPLAGILAAMEWAGKGQVLTVAGDTPFFPDDLADRLSRQEGRIVIAASGGKLHPVFGLWDTGLASKLRASLAGGTRKIMDFVEAHPFSVCEFGTDPDPFFNINSPEDLLAAEARA